MYLLEYRLTLIILFRKEILMQVFGRHLTQAMKQLKLVYIVFHHVATRRKEIVFRL